MTFHSLSMETVKTNSLKAWILASRPKTLSGAAVPVMIGLSAAYVQNGHQLNVIPAVLCLLFALIMQIDANFVNDYFDWKKGNDDEETRLGPLRACSQGWVTPKAMLIALVATTAIGCAVGLPLVYYGGWEMILVGIACVVFCILYTTVFSYLGLGDILVLVFFGIVPVCITFYIQTKVITLDAFLLSVACGLAIDNLLIVNNYRDIENDKRDGKITLIVRIGKEAGSLLYLANGIVALAIVVYCLGIKNPQISIMFLFFILHMRTDSKLDKYKGRELNKVLGMTARNILVFGICTSLALILS